jgi:hypothetical protein
VKRCSKCGREKALDAFAWRNKARGVRQSCCRVCQQAYGKSWYGRNGDKHRANVAKNNERYREELRAVVVAAKDVPCTDCKRRFPVYAMDFDHVSGVKLGNIAELARGHRSIGRLRSEIAKCEIVCAVCHRIRTFHRRGLIDDLLVV